ncbi:hypothetical protein BGW38_005583, partial [Lunasporangiospora selenospora]
MEVLRENFHSELPWIKEAIEGCDFVAIDAEFSGLHTDQNRRHQNTTLEEGYSELRKSATQFLVVQIGISTFTFDPTIGAHGEYVARPFNFYIFPTSLTGYAPQGRCFLTEASSLDFLARNRFNFNKWVFSGVHYMTKAEEEAYIKEKLKVVNNEQDDIAIDAINAEWIAGVLQRIEDWESDPTAMNFINISTTNAYQRRLVYQEVRRRWSNGLHARSQGGYINITKWSEKQRESEHQHRMTEMMRDIEQSRGFRTVIEMLIMSQKPIVGHNIVVDLAYILAQFVGPLPETMEGYKKMIHDNFPTVIDTKYIGSTAIALKGLAYDSSLGGLEGMTHSVPFSGMPRVTLDYRHANYGALNVQNMSHEAGYDAYITGIILVKMLSYIKKTEDDILATRIEMSRKESESTSRAITVTNPNEASPGAAGIEKRTEKDKKEKIPSSSTVDSPSRDGGNQNSQHNDYPDNSNNHGSKSKGNKGAKPSPGSQPKKSPPATPAPAQTSGPSTDLTSNNKSPAKEAPKTFSYAAAVSKNKSAEPAASTTSTPVESSSTASSSTAPAESNFLKTSPPDEAKETTNPTSKRHRGHNSSVDRHPEGAGNGNGHGHGRQQGPNQSQYQNQGRGYGRSQDHGHSNYQGRSFAPNHGYGHGHGHGHGHSHGHGHGHGHNHGHGYEHGYGRGYSEYDGQD